MTYRSKKNRRRKAKQGQIRLEPGPFKSFLSALVKLGGLVVAGGVVGVVLLSMTLGFFVWRIVPTQVQHIVLEVSEKDGQESKFYYLNIDGHNQRYEVVSFEPQLWSKLEEAEEISGQLPTSNLELSLFVNRLVHHSWQIEASDAHLASISHTQLAQLLTDASWGRVDSNLSRIQRIWLGWLLFRANPTFFSFSTLDSIQEWQGPTSFLSLGFSENCSVAVINTTQTRGLATTFAQLFQNSGVRVVRITDAPMTRSESKVAMRPEAECFNEATALQNIAAAEREVEFNQQLSDQYRAEVVVLLGSDISRQVTEFTGQ